MRLTASASSAREHAARQEDLLGHRLAHQLLQPPAGTGRGEDSQPGLGVADADAGRADPEVRGVGELRAAAQAVAVQRRDDGHGQLGDADEDRGVDALQGVVPAPFAQLGDVRAGGKHAVHARDDQHLGVLLQRGADHVQFIHHLLVDGVADLGAVEEHHHPVVALLDQERGEVTVLELSGRAVRGRHQTRSSSMAVPWPTPMHMVARPDLGVLAFHPAQQGDGDP